MRWVKYNTEGAQKEGSTFDLEEGKLPRSYQKLQDKVSWALTDETKQWKQKLEGRKKLRWYKEGMIVKKKDVLKYKWCTMLKSTLIALFAYIHTAVLSKYSLV